MTPALAHRRQLIGDGLEPRQETLGERLHAAARQPAELAARLGEVRKHCTSPAERVGKRMHLGS
jgi:hypothetical protein